MKIPIHSFVDLITNSSSEVFITSDRQTVSSLEKIVDAILIAAGVTDKCSDLFRIGLDVVEGGYGNYKVIYVEARDTSCRASAVALEKLNYVFTTAFDERDAEYVVSAITDTPSEIENVINSVLSDVRSTTRSLDLFTITTQQPPAPTNEVDYYNPPPRKLIVEATKPESVEAAKLLSKIDEIFIAERVGSG